MSDFDKMFPRLEVGDEIIEKNLTIDELSALIDRFTGGKTEEKTDELFSMKNNEYFHFYRFDYAKIFGWSIPSVSALEKIKEFVDTDTVLEIAAGRGFWSALMKSIGMNVIATSIADGHYYSANDMEKTWLNVELLDCVEAVNTYSDANCLFISWVMVNFISLCIDSKVTNLLSLVKDLVGVLMHLMKMKMNLALN